MSVPRSRRWLCGTKPCKGTWIVVSRISANRVKLLLYAASLFQVVLVLDLNSASELPRHYPTDSVLASRLEAALLAPLSVLEPPAWPWLPSLRCKGRSSNCTASASGTDPGTATEAFRQAITYCHQLPSSPPQCAMDKSVDLLRRICRPILPAGAHGGLGQISDLYTLNLSSVLDFFAYSRLRLLAVAHANHFSHVAPFPHVVLDGFLPKALFDVVEQEVPEMDIQRAAMYCSVGMRECPLEPAFSWLKWDMPMRKIADHDFAPEARLGPATRLLLGFLRSASFISFLEQLTGVRGLLPDPLMWGGGVHQTAQGGYLVPHTDFQSHPFYRGFERRVNLFLYLNHDWENDFGGDLELWENGSMARCVKRIRTIANRVVIFLMSARSWHGHPWPLGTPPGRTRRSLAFYYYTVSVRAFAGSLPKMQVLPVPCSHSEDPTCYGATVSV